MPLANWTGRTTFVLQYDAQELPWSNDFEAGVDEAAMPSQGLPSVDALVELAWRWKDAYKHSIEASEFLSSWLQRWTRGGRRVLVAGFSLGARVGWNSVQQSPDGRIEAMLILGALGNSASTWRSLPDVGRVLNVWSSRDRVLSWVYPQGVPKEECVATGVAPVHVQDCPHMLNIEVSDLVKGHGEASRRLSSLVDLLMAVELGTSGGAVVAERALQRRLRFAPDVTASDLVELIDPILFSREKDFDWSSLVLLDRDEQALRQTGLATLSLHDALLGSCPEIARRSIWRLRGAFRRHVSCVSPELQRRQPALLPVVTP